MNDFSDLVDFSFESDDVEAKGTSSDLVDLVDFSFEQEDVGTDIECSGVEDLVDFSFDDSESGGTIEDSTEGFDINSLVEDFDSEDFTNIGYSSSPAEVVDTSSVDSSKGFIKSLLNYIKLHKKGVVLGYGCLILAVVVTIFITRVADNGSEPVNRGIESYIKAFTSGEFETCDSMVLKESDKLIGYDIDLSGSYGKSVDMYKALLMTGVKCIDEVLVSDDGSVTISVKQVKLTDEVSVDEKALNNLFTRFKGNLLGREDFKQELEKLYFDAFERSVCTDYTGEIVKNVEVGIKVDEQGYIRNTNALVRQVLRKSGLLENMKMFEDSIQATLSYYIHGTEE